MTPLERANQIVEEWAPRASVGSGARTQLRDDIQRAILEATNSEVERRRALEQTFILKLEQGYKTVRLVVVNPVDGQEYTANMQARVATDLRDDAATKAAL